MLKGGAFGSDACTTENLMFNFDTNCKAVFEVMRVATPHLKTAGKAAGPSFVTVSSVNGIQSFAGVTSYCVSKAAVDMLTKCASLDLAPFGIRVNSVNPGLVTTELQKRGGMTDAAYEAL